MSGCASAQPNSALDLIQERGAVVPGVPVSQATAPIDFKSLEARLWQTNAIGTFTKLNLKTQLDDLLGQFRAYYQGDLKASLTDLRRNYDRLVLRVLALLQDADPQLATEITLSRESLWGVLSHPVKFTAVFR